MDLWPIFLWISCNPFHRFMINDLPGRPGSACSFPSTPPCPQVCAHFTRPHCSPAWLTSSASLDSSSSLPRWLGPTKRRGSPDDVCFRSPNSQEAVRILSVSSKARSRAGLALQRLRCSSCFGPWRQNDIMQNVGCVICSCVMTFFFASVLHYEGNENISIILTGGGGGARARKNNRGALSLSAQTNWTGFACTVSFGL